jgi:hypothetical protein
MMMDQRIPKLTFVLDVDNRLHYELDSPGNCEISYLFEYYL